MAKSEQPAATPRSLLRVRLGELTGGVEGRLLVAGVVLAVVGWLAAFWLMSSVPFTGDETFYTNNAKRIADFLTGREGSLGLLQKHLVRYGWFMPGPSLLMTPLFLVNPEPSLGAVRAYTSLVYIALWVWAMREVGHTFGRYASAALLVFPTLAGMWLLFATTVWGDLPAGLVLAIVAARTYRVAVAMLERQPIRVRDAVMLELLLAAMVYLRGNTIIVVLAVHAVLFGTAALSWQWSLLLRRAAVLVAGGAMFAMLLAPWSIAASRQLGDRVITTSSAPLSLAMTFGDPDQICFGRCKTDAVWYWAVIYSRRYGEEHGISQIEAQRRMSTHARRDVTLNSYLAQTRENFRAYVSPTGLGPRRGRPFLDRFTRLSTRDLSPASATTIKTAVRIETLLLYVPFFLALVAANLVVVRRDGRLQVLSLLVKALTISLFVQPFVHQSHSRYWVAYAPLLTIAAVFLARWWVSRTGSSAALAAPSSADTPLVAVHEAATARRPRMIMTWLQAAYVVAIVVAALVVTFG